MLSVVEEKLLECHVNFPSFGERTPNDLVLLAKVFDRHLAEYSDREVAAAFDAHVATGTRFPTVADILAHFATVTAYRMDNGPDGHGGIYAADHPYVRFQQRLGTNLAQYAVEVPAREHPGLKTAAACSSWAPIEADDEAPRIDRRGSGLRRLSHAV